MYTKRESLSWAFNEQTVTIKDEASGLFFPLDEVGSLIWDMLDGSNNNEMIANEICKIYDVSPEEAKEDVDEMIDNFLEYDLIEDVGS